MRTDIQIHIRIEDRPRPRVEVEITMDGHEEMALTLDLAQDRGRESTSIADEFITKIEESILDCIMGITDGSIGDAGGDPSFQEN